MVAAWILDLAKDLLGTTVQLDGVDISADNFPSTASQSENVHLHVCSITKLPEGWSEKYDVVNQRYLNGGLTAEGWVDVMNEIFRVLKPGGVVQLVEREITCPPNIQSGPVKDIYSTMETFFVQTGRIFNCAVHLPEMLRKVGFVDIKSERNVLPAGKRFGHDGEVGARANGGAFKGFGESLIHQGFTTDEQYGEMLRGLHKFWDEEGEEIGCWIVCAQKPL